ncbi:MAG: STAS domain-containing protein [Terracidiphilus sp.]|jgi:anti-anti-sigma factor
MGIALDQANDACLLRLEGVVDISSAAELKAALLEAIAEGKAIRVSAEDVSDLDVCAYQLLWAAEREANRSGLQFAFTGKLSETIESSLASAGLERLAVPGDRERLRDDELIGAGTGI